MITFSCASCREQYSVDDSQAGQMGRCPNCNAVMRIPAKSTNIFQIFKGNDYFSDKKLNQLYADFLKNNEHLVVSQKIDKGDNSENAIVEMRTTGNRTQIVFIFRYTQNNYTFVSMASYIGKIKYNETAVAALRAVNMFSIYTISLDDDNELVVSNLRLIDGFTTIEFAAAISAIANFADKMEKDIFGSDAQ
jgi:DNA-directed RNA polymerase subunit RPC12/RpoP